MFAHLHAVTVRDAVSFANVWEQFDADGSLLRPEGVRKAKTVLLARLRWCATALRHARKAAPYGQVAA